MTNLSMTMTKTKLYSTGRKRSIGKESALEHEMNMPDSFHKAPYIVFWLGGEAHHVSRMPLDGVAYYEDSYGETVMDDVPRFPSIQGQIQYVTNPYDEDIILVRISHQNTEFPYIDNEESIKALRRYLKPGVGFWFLADVKKDFEEGMALATKRLAKKLGVRYYGQYLGITECKGQVENGEGHMRHSKRPW